MAAKTPAHKAAPQQVENSKWRTFVVSFLIALGTIALLNWLIVRWTEKYLLTTDNFVATVAPLSRNETVASAVSNYAVGKLYEDINLEAKVREALPEKATFLAAPLSSQITTTSQNAGTKIIMSDQFGGIWETSLRTAHAKLLTELRKPTNAAETASPPPERTVFGVNITPLLQQIRERVSAAATPNVTSENKDKATEIAISLKDQFNQARLAIRLTDALYSILLVTVIACYLGAAAVANSRWKATLAIGLSVTVVTALELIFLKAARPEIIGQVATANQAAAGVIWDALTKGFVSVTTNTLILGLILTALTIFAGPFAWAQRVRGWIGLEALSKTKFFGWIRSGRQWLRSHISYARIGGVVVSFVYLIASSNITWQTIVQTIFAYFIFVSVVELLATRSKVSHG